MPLVSLFLCGDVMLGRGIDQILPYPSSPEVYELSVDDAREYVSLAEEKNGKIAKPVDFSYVWGDALSHFEQLKPDLRIINLETSITQSDDHWGDKGINYRMNPKNAPCLTAAKIDCCILGNNHVLDWGYSGLKETMNVLRAEDIQSCGAGVDEVEAESAAVFDSSMGEVIVFSFGSPSSGVPSDWAATKKRSGVNFLDEREFTEIERVKSMVKAIKREDDICLASIHWGANWGYDVPAEQCTFAHRLIDEADVELIHGHSSHHPKSIEVYHGKLVLYGCGDLLNDYEGIRSFEEFRGDLGLMYFADLDENSSSLLSLQMVPTKIRKLSLNDASKAEAVWLSRVMNRESMKMGCQVVMGEGNLHLKWKR